MVSLRRGWWRGVRAAAGMACRRWVCSGGTGCCAAAVPMASAAVVVSQCAAWWRSRRVLRAPRSPVMAAESRAGVIWLAHPAMSASRALATSAIVGARAELAAGDLRPLYLAWLAGYGTWERDEDAFDYDEEDELKSRKVFESKRSLHT